MLQPTPVSAGALGQFPTKFVCFSERGQRDAGQEKQLANKQERK